MAKSIKIYAPAIWVFHKSSECFKNPVSPTEYSPSKHPLNAFIILGNSGLSIQITNSYSCKSNPAKPCGNLHDKTFAYYKSTCWGTIFSLCVVKCCPLNGKAWFITLICLSCTNYIVSVAWGDNWPCFNFNAVKGIVGSTILYRGGGAGRDTLCSSVCSYAHTFLQNMSYRKEILMALLPCLPMVLAQQFRLPRYMCTLILAMLSLKAATPQASYPHREEAGETHHSAARASQDQLPFCSKTNTVISLLSISGWILRRAGRCSGNNKEQAVSGALCSRQGVLPSRPILAWQRRARSVPDAPGSQSHTEVQCFW